MDFKPELLRGHDIFLDRIKQNAQSRIILPKKKIIKKSTEIYLDEPENRIYSGSGSVAFNYEVQTYRTGADWDMDSKSDFLLPYSEKSVWSDTFYFFDKNNNDNIEILWSDFHTKAQEYGNIVDADYPRYVNEPAKIAHPLVAFAKALLHCKHYADYEDTPIPPSDRGYEIGILPIDPYFLKMEMEKTGNRIYNIRIGIIQWFTYFHDTFPILFLINNAELRVYNDHVEIVDWGTSGSINKLIYHTELSWYFWNDDYEKKAFAVYDWLVDHGFWELSDGFYAEYGGVNNSLRWLYSCLAQPMPEVIIPQITSPTTIYLDKTENSGYSASGIYSDYPLITSLYKTAGGWNIKHPFTVVSNGFTFQNSFYLYNQNTNDPIIYPFMSFYQDAYNRLEMSCPHQISGDNPLGLQYLPMYLNEERKIVHPLQVITYAINSVYADMTTWEDGDYGIHLVSFTINQTMTCNIDLTFSLYQSLLDISKIITYIDELTCTLAITDPINNISWSSSLSGGGGIISNAQAFNYYYEEKAIPNGVNVVLNDFYILEEPSAPLHVSFPEYTFRISPNNHTYPSPYASNPHDITNLITAIHDNYGDIHNWLGFLLSFIVFDEPITKESY